jgi:hypothetical protein
MCRRVGITDHSLPSNDGVTPLGVLVIGAGDVGFGDEDGAADEDGPDEKDGAGEKDGADEKDAVVSGVEVAGGVRGRSTGPKVAHADRPAATRATSTTSRRCLTSISCAGQHVVDQRPRTRRYRDRRTPDRGIDQPRQPQVPSVL